MTLGDLPPDRQFEILLYSGGLMTLLMIVLGVWPGLLAYTVVWTFERALEDDDDDDADAADDE